MVVAHGETAVAKRARHLCDGRARGREREGRKRERRQRPGERETSEEAERGWYGTGQWLGGIWVNQGQPDRRKRGDGGVIRLKRKGRSQTEGNGC